MLCIKTTIGSCLLVLLASGGLLGCAEHQHDTTSDIPSDHHSMDPDAGSDFDAGHEEHVPRDPATQPCDSTNWVGFVPDLRACVLSGIVLDGANLRRVDLSDGDLSGASLVGADLFKAMLMRASFVNANLSDAHMVSVDLTDANLVGANLKGADLTNAILINTKLDTTTTTDETTICPNLMVGPCW